MTTVDKIPPCQCNIASVKSATLSPPLPSPPSTPPSHNLMCQRFSMKKSAFQVEKYFLRAFFFMNMRGGRNEGIFWRVKKNIRRSWKSKKNLVEKRKEENEEKRKRLCLSRRNKLSRFNILSPIFPCWLLAWVSRSKMLYIYLFIYNIRKMLKQLDLDNIRKML